jgi:hypothetical protein
VVDDSFPHCFDLEQAIGRMASRGDVLLVDGGLVSPPGTIEWSVNLPAGIAAVLGHHPEASLLPGSTSITGCILSSLLAQHDGALATAGPGQRGHLPRSLADAGADENRRRAAGLRTLVGERHLPRPVRRPVRPFRRLMRCMTTITNSRPTDRMRTPLSRGHARCAR